MIPPWALITAFGDTSVLLPAVAIFAVWLVARHQAHLMVYWCALLTLVAGLVVASKLMFMAWNIGVAAWDFTGFSGHTAMSVAVWPPALSLLPQRNNERLSMVAGVAGFLLAFLIAWSRIELRAHSFTEVIGAFLIGLVSTVMFLRALWPSWTLAGGRTLPIASLLIVLSATYGHPFPTEQILRSVAMQLNSTHMTYRRALRH